MLALAGAVYYVIFSHGPPEFTPRDPETLPVERQEAINEQFKKDLIAAIIFHGQMTDFVNSDQYDDDFEPVVEAFVSIDGDGKNKVDWISGTKN